MRWLDVLLGARLANREYGQRKIGAFEGLPAMGLDGLGSSAYGPEAALTILIPLGAAGSAYIEGIMAPIIALLIILFVSYWQTIRAYPNNGGAYIVTKENLGVSVSLLAAAALMIDYVLNVAFGISAGVGALVSAAPTLHPYILPICLGVLALVAIVNLRGTLDAGRLFAPPTYLFIASFVVVVAIGTGKSLLSGGHPAPVAPLPPPAQTAESLSLWLLARAFASGCTAMTGVEAVSNGMSAFREPPVKYGHRTLAAIVGILAMLLAGIAYLARSYRIMAMDQTQPGYRSVLSQLVGAVVGENAFYYVAIGSLLCVLVLSANTSFVDFPRLCRMVAEDGFLPKPFAIAGRRLVFSAGILYLAATTGALLIAFGGITDRLIPLFAIGAFLTFTLSQAGMAVHWRRALRRSQSRREAGAHHVHFWINAAGACATGLALIVIVFAKFLEGAWITILVIPSVIGLLVSINRYYRGVAREICDPEPLRVESDSPPIILIPIEDWDKLTDRALRLALTLSRDVVAIHLTHLSGPEAAEHEQSLRTRWRRGVEQPAETGGTTPPRLMILQAQYRAIHEPVLKLAGELQQKFPGRRVAVLIPEVVKRRWYQYLLHAGYADHLRRQLLREGDPRLIVIDVPWRL
jgi:amino acid transporter